MNTNSWYLLYCKRNEQQRAVVHLERQGVQYYYPKILIEKVRQGRRKAIIEPLFPNYVFISFDVNAISFTTIRSTRGVVDFIRLGAKPAVVPQELIEQLQQNEEMRTQHNAQGELTPGDEIEIISGQFAGTEAIFKEADGEYRSILLIKMLNTQVTVSTANQAMRKKNAIS